MCVIYDPGQSKLYGRVAAPKIAELNKMKETKAENIHLQDEIGDIAPTDFLQYIIDRHKGKTILIGKWEVWCGPCRLGHKEMAPMKEDEKYKDVVFIYLASSSSDLNQWMEMTKDIPGEHYYLNDQQSRNDEGQLETGGGVPAYAIFNAKGEKTFTQLGRVWRGNNTPRTRQGNVYIGIETYNVKSITSKVNETASSFAFAFIFFSCSFSEIVASKE